MWPYIGRGWLLTGSYNWTAPMADPQKSHSSHQRVAQLLAVSCGTWPDGARDSAWPTASTAGTLQSQQAVAFTPRAGQPHLPP